MIDLWLIVGASVAVCGFWGVPAHWRADYTSIVGFAGLTIVSPTASGALTALTLTVYLATRPEAATLRFGGSLLAIGFAFLAYKLLLANASDSGSLVRLIGLAYAVPRAAHVIIDVRLGTASATTFRSLSSYMWFWPVIVIGPIHRFQNYQREVNRRRWDPTMFARSVERIVFGLFTAIVIGNYLIPAALRRTTRLVGPSRDGFLAAARSVEYGLNLYAVLGGWSSVAIGLAAAHGVRVTENFDRPFLQPNIAAFWRGWHISLTRWATDYLYRPSIANWRRHILAITITMVAIGLWHEISARYLVWGAYHAAGLATHRRFRVIIDRRQSDALRPFASRIAHITSVFATALFVFASFTITRTDSLADALSEFSLMLTGGW